MPLNVKPDQSRLTTLLTDTVVLLCKNGLNFQSTLRVVGVLGITIDDNDVFIVHLNENVSSVTPDTPDVTSYSDTVDKPKTAGADSHRSFHSEKRVVPHSTPRSGKLLGHLSNNKPVVRTWEGSTAPEDGLMKTDRGSRENEIHIKEENVEIISGETTDRSPSYGPEEEERGTEVSSRREKRTFKWTREIGHGSVSGSTDYATGTNETFVQNDGRVADPHGGMDVTDEWNLDALALSSLSLPGAADGDVVPPWPGYAWAGGTYPQECLPGELSHSQSMVGLKTRAMIRDGSTQPDVERHGFALLKPFACPVVGCNRRFYHRNNVYRHRKQKHGENVLGLTNRRR